jgi:hypothetical protein
MGVGTTEALVLVKNTQENVKDRIARIVGAGFGINIEQDDVGRRGGCLLNIRPYHGITQLVLVKKIYRRLGVAMGVIGFFVFQKIRQCFEKV